MTNSKTNSTDYPFHQYPYRIRNWRKYQHYKFRNPPWIKLHTELLSSEDWVVLDDASRVLAITIMLIAVKHDGHIPASATPAYFKRVGYLNSSPNLKPLIECGFLEKTLANASKVEHLRTNADTETETETETEKKVRVEAPQAVPQLKLVKGTSENRGTRLPEGWNPSPKVMDFAVALLRYPEAVTELDKFRDYWTAIPGARGRKLNWDSTFKNWCRNSRGSNGHGPRPSTLKERTADALQRIGRPEICEITDLLLPKLSDH